VLNHGYDPIYTMMKSKLTKAYIFLARAGLAFIFTFRIYRLWSKIYSLIFLDKETRRCLPNLYGTIQVPLARVSKVPYVPDGPKELWDVCQPPGVVEKRIIAIENDEPYDTKGAMDCDDYARYLANSIESQFNPRLMSVLCIDKRKLKWGIIPEFPGHMVCLWTDSQLSMDTSGKIYHIGNWNQRKDIHGNLVEPWPADHYNYDNLSGLANDLVNSMAGDDGELLAWIIMDHDLKVCCWGLGDCPELRDINSISLSSARPTSFIG